MDDFYERIDKLEDTLFNLQRAVDGLEDRIKDIEGRLDYMVVSLSEPAPALKVLTKADSEIPETDLVVKDTEEDTYGDFYGENID